MTTAYTASNNVPLAALPNMNGIVQKFLAATTNPADATYAPDGLAAAPIFGLGGQQLQGDEIVAGGIATVVSYIGPLLNSGAVCWVLLECEGGAQQVAPATHSQHAVQFNQMTGLIGAMSNAKMLVGAASTTATFSADQIIVGSALNGLQYSVANFSKTIDLSTIGVGGMDTGTAPASGYVALYAIYNSVTRASGLIAVDSTSINAPTVYSNGHMPSGYTASSLVSVWATDGGRKLMVGAQIGRWINRTSTAVLNTFSAQEVYASLNISAGVPCNARRAKFLMNNLNNTAITAQAMFLALDSNGSGEIVLFNTTAWAENGTAVTSTLDIATSQTIFYRLQNNGGGTPSFSATVTGYEI